ncbi:MAG: hypothetical protein LBK44_02470 [Spirochaetales bacterium]|nr:hypothetical protein [Spirochaetales bacterium]
MNHPMNYPNKNYTQESVAVFRHLLFVPGYTIKGQYGSHPEQDTHTGIFILVYLGAFFAVWENPQTAKNQAFRCKSSEAPMRFLWAFRCNPLRGGSSKTSL